jgi:hypothetical protein
MAEHSLVQRTTSPCGVDYDRSVAGSLTGGSVVSSRHLKLVRMGLQSVAFAANCTSG